MTRYYSHTIILPDETLLTDFVVEVCGCEICYFPFSSEIHSTIYVEHPILLSYRDDLQGKSVSLSQLAWALGSDSGNVNISLYSLLPCPLCSEGRFKATKL